MMTTNGRMRDIALDLIDQERGRRAAFYRLPDRPDN